MLGPIGVPDAIIGQMREKGLEVGWSVGEWEKSNGHTAQSLSS